MTDWHAYERRKAAWVQAHPNATPDEYEQAARTEFRGDKLHRASSTERMTGLPTRSAHVRLCGKGELRGR